MRFPTAAALLFLAICAPVAAQAAGETGTLAPDFHLGNIQGAQPDSFSLSGARGSVVVIAFWNYA